MRLPAAENACYNPLRDVVAPPFDDMARELMEVSRKLSVEDIIAAKTS